MNFQIMFDGTVSTVLIHLWNAVERQLSSGGLRLQAQAVAQSVTNAVTTTAAEPCKWWDVPCLLGLGGHGPYIVIGLLVGGIVGYVIGRQSASRTSKS